VFRLPYWAGRNRLALDFRPAVTALLYFLSRIYVTLPVTAEEMFLLQTRQPALILKAIATSCREVRRGSSGRNHPAAGLTFAWIALASLDGRNPQDAFRTGRAIRRHREPGG